MHMRRIRTEFETITFKDGEHIDEFGMRILNLTSTLRSFCNTIDDEKIIRKFLSVVPTRFVQITVSIETLLDLVAMSVEEVMGHLRAVEERLDDDQGASGGQFLLTERQWEEKKKQGRDGGPSNGSNDEGLDRADGNFRRKGGQSKQKPASHPTVGDYINHDKFKYYKKKCH
jgi:hypothetical protein